MVDEAEMICKARRGHPGAIAGVDWHGGGRLRSGGRQHLGVKVRAKIVGGGLGGFATMPGCGMKSADPISGHYDVGGVLALGVVG